MRGENICSERTNDSVVAASSSCKTIERYFYYAAVSTAVSLVVLPTDTKHLLLIPGASLPDLRTMNHVCS